MEAANLPFIGLDTRFCKGMTKFLVWLSILLIQLINDLNVQKASVLQFLPTWLCGVHNYAVDLAQFYPR